MKTVDIHTNQNVVITYELAVLWQRMVAFLMDLIIIGAIFWLLSLVAVATIFLKQSQWIAIVLTVGFPFVFIGYFLLTNLWLKGQSPGKRVMKLKIMKFNGQPVRWGDVLLRDLFLFPEVIITSGLLGALLIGATDRNQRLGDILANTVVVNERNSQSVSLKGLLSRRTTADYAPAFPQVTRLSEHELLLVNRALERARNYPSKAHEQAMETVAQKMEDKLNITRQGYATEAFLRRLSQDYVLLTR